MAWEFDRIEDGDTANAGSLNVPLLAAKTALNNIDGEMVRRGAFNHEHALSIVSSAGGSTIYKVGDDGIHEYKKTVFGAYADYIAYDTDGGSEVSPLAGGATGWICVGHPLQSDAGYGDGLAKVTYVTPVDFDTDKAKFIWVLFNVDLHKVTATDPAGLIVGFCIQFRSGGTWYTAAVTERFISANDHMIDMNDADEEIQMDCPISFFLTPDEVRDKTGSVTSVQAVRAMMTVVNPLPSADWVVKLKQWNLSALPITADTSSF